MEFKLQNGRPWIHLCPGIFLGAIYQRVQIASIGRTSRLWTGQVKSILRDFLRILLTMVKNIYIFSTNPVFNLNDRVALFFNIITVICRYKGLFRYTCIPGDFLTVIKQIRSFLTVYSPQNFNNLFTWTFYWARD